MNKIIIIAFIFILQSCNYVSVYDIETNTNCTNGPVKYSRKIKAPNDRKALIIAMDSHVRFLSTMQKDCSDVKVFKNGKEVMNILSRETMDSLMDNVGDLPAELRKSILIKY